MADGKAGGRQSKDERRQERIRDAQRRRLVRQLQRGLVVGAILAVPALWVYEYRGPQEIVEAEVIETVRWRHTAPGQRPHPHVRAVLLIEGVEKATLERADGYQRGQRIPVWIRRGRLTGRARFRDIAGADESDGRELDEPEGDA